MPDERPLEIIRCPDHLGRERMKQEVAASLSESPKRLPSKYFYDTHGSRLFEKICTLPEYYLPRTERTILEAAAPAIMVGFDGGSLIELGSGASLRIRPLLAALPGGGRGVTYVAVDLCEPALQQATRALRRLYPELSLRGIVTDFTGSWDWLVGPPRLIAFLGSNIGNFDTEGCLAFCTGLRRRMAPGDRLIAGFDLVKEKTVLETAYNDQQGVTAAFNRNILMVINRGLDGDFDPAAFDHVAFYSESKQQIEMHLRARRTLTVHLAAVPVRFSLAAGETVLTEICRKFTRESVVNLAWRAGLELTGWFTDPRQWFALAEFAPADGGTKRT